MACTAQNPYRMTFIEGISVSLVSAISIKFVVFQYIKFAMHWRRRSQTKILQKMVKYMGKRHQSKTQRGGLIFMLKGCSALVILRAFNDGVNSISIMRGELVDRPVANLEEV